MSVKRARTLRKRMPPAEARVWNLLRTEPLSQFHFRRQVPLGPYFADFASHAVKMVIEVDGDTHGTDAAMAYDRVREKHIENEGYAVLRFSNLEVMNNLDGVGERLLLALEETPTRPGDAGPPSPQGGGRSRTNTPEQKVATND